MSQAMQRCPAQPPLLGMMMSRSQVGRGGWDQSIGQLVAWLVDGVCRPTGLMWQLVSRPVWCMAVSAGCAAATRAVLLAADPQFATTRSDDGDDAKHCKLPCTHALRLPCSSACAGDEAISSDEN